MDQAYKSVYFSDCRQTGPRRSSLTLAFGKKDHEVYEAVKHLSSDTLRGVLGYESFGALQKDVQAQDKSLNSFCLSILRSHVREHETSTVSWLPGFETESPFPIDPVQATYAGGRDEPLHKWFPWLEGYSPAFVKSVIRKYCPNAKSVLDPFAGVGTTPLTASRLGIKAYYSEINPVLQFLISLKTTALKLNDRERAALVAELSLIADTLDERITGSHPDLQLSQTFKYIFGKSKYFSDDVFDDVLRCRTLIDNVGNTSSICRSFLTIAVLRALIPASHLIRRGDLRFKRESELECGQVEIRHEIRKALSQMADDIAILEPIVQTPFFVLENAKNLGHIPKLAVDAVITSPPYLNGTNYFRNTKVELWFLRCVKEKKDLARFRFRSITAGINDVTKGKQAGDVPPSAISVLKAMKDSAYDVRIPRMVECFAAEMHSTLQKLVEHTSKKGMIAIDIGDSAYAGIHVPTDLFIKESIDAAGFRLKDEHVLRQRVSRSQMNLAQKLLIFEPKYEKNRSIRTPKNIKKSWSCEWEKFKRNLPHQKGIFAKRNWGNPLHTLCSYQGKMKPSLAAHLVRTFAKPGDRILDPFSGVGTIPFEAALLGVNSWGFDISPPAFHITAAKVGERKASECFSLLNELEHFLKLNETSPEEINSAKAIRFNGALPAYFNDNTLNEVLLARRFFLSNPPANASQSLVLSSLLHILHGNRPYALSRRSHPITPFSPTGESAYRALMPRLRAKVDRSLAAPIPKEFVYGHSLYQDATDLWPTQIDTLDAVITSPPFFDSTRFHLGNWMRLWFCGWEAADFRTQPKAFVDERQKLSFDVYHPVLRQCRERLKPNGVAVFHLGASKKCDMVIELARIAKTWFKVADVYAESVSHCEKHGLRDKGTTVSHQYLILE